MKFPLEKQNELYELDRKMRVVGPLPCGLMVYVRTDEHAYAPHVHICDVKTRGCRFHACILLTVWQYYVHPLDEYPYCEGRRDYLNHAQERRLVRLLREKRADGMETNWEYAVRCWNESRYPSRVMAQRMPKCGYLNEGAYDWIAFSISSLEHPVNGGLKYSLLIPGPKFEEGREPHFHIVLDDYDWSDFQFEISIIDILSKDELHLVAMRDSRDPEKEIVHLFGDECSWSGYEKLCESLRQHLATAEGRSGSTRNDGDTHLHSLIWVWNDQNRHEGCYGYRIGDYMRRNGIPVLPKYRKMMTELHKGG